MKKCVKCNRYKKTSLFNICRAKKDGFSSYCKKCTAKYRGKYYKKNKKKLTKYSRNYHKNNRNKVLKIQKLYRQKNKTKIKKTIKKWVIKNKKRVKTIKANYQKQKRKSPFYRFVESLRTRTRLAFRVKKFTKPSGISKILGCSFEELKVHVENKFTKGMNWKNYGKWHIDHIKPIGKAKNKIEALKLSHYTNLQPLWAKENFLKGAKRETN